jgi:TatD DNase family protein
MLIDSHCHLDFPDFAAETPDIVARARANGVSGMLTIGTKLSQFAAVRAVAESYDRIWCSVGVHPHEAAEEIGIDAARLMDEARHPKVVAYGETGLDYYYEHSPRQAQAQSFREHLSAARQTGLPVVIHTRDADDDMAAILKDEMGKGAFGAVLHCFSSGRALAETAIELGLYVSFSGILTFKKADELRAIARDLPANRILVETDAPYLAPVPHRGKRNEPAFVTDTAKALAALRGVGLDELARQTTENFFRLFPKAAHAG